MTQSNSIFCHSHKLNKTISTMKEWLIELKKGTKVAKEYGNQRTGMFNENSIQYTG